MFSRFGQSSSPPSSSPSRSTRQGQPNLLITVQAGGSQRRWFSALVTSQGRESPTGARQRPVCPVWRVIVTGRENYPRRKAPGSSSRRALFADVRLQGVFFGRRPRWILIGSNAAGLSRALCARPVTERCSRFVEPGLSRQFYGEILDSVSLGRRAPRSSSRRSRVAPLAVSRSRFGADNHKPSGCEAT